MLRSQFIQNIITIFGANVLPADMVKHYQKVYLLQSFVRGFAYYKGPELLASMSENQLLDLVREPDNIHDNRAIALYYNNEKIGYIPRESNKTISKLMDANLLEFIAEITHLEHDAATWENVHVAISVLKPIEPFETTEIPEYLTKLVSPNYYTLSDRQNYITKICTDRYEPMSSQNFYEELVDNSDNDGVYDLIHNTFEDGDRLQDAVNLNKFVINTSTMPNSLMEDAVCYAFDIDKITLDNVMNEPGYVIANLARLPELSPIIQEFKPITSLNGQNLFEVIFRN